MASEEHFKKYYVTDKINQKIISAIDVISAAQIFVRTLVDEGIEKLNVLEKIEENPFAKEKTKEEVYSLGEYIYVSERGYHNVDMDAKDFSISIAVSVLKAIGEDEMASLMDEEMSEIKSMEKLRKFMNQKQQAYLDYCIDNSLKEKEIERLLE